MTGLFWGGTAFLAVFVAAVWLDLIFDLSSALRIAAWGVASVAGSAILALLLRAAARQMSRHRLSDRLDAVAGSGGQVRAGVDLSESTARVAAYSRQPEMTSALAEIAVDRAAEIAGAVQPSTAVPARPVRRSLTALAVVVAVLGLIMLALPRVAFTQWLRFAHPFADHPAWSPYEFHVEPPGARVVYGRSLDLQVRVEGPPVDQLELVLDWSSDSASAPGQRDVLPLFEEPGGGWRASIADITRPGQFHVRNGAARSRTYSIEVITVPTIENVRCRIAPPAYTQESPYAGPIPKEGIAGLPGTMVSLTATSNRLLSRGTLEVIAGDERRQIPLQPAGQGSQTVSGEFEIGSAGRIELRVIDVEGQPSTDVVAAPIVLLRDEHPFVRLIQPRAVSFATPTAVVPVVVDAEDDYGIVRCQLFRSLNDSRYLPVEVPIAAAARRVHEATVLPLAAYGLQPGDQIKLFARVEDNDPAAIAENGAGKGAESAIALIRIISQSEFDRMQRSRDGLQMLASKYQQAQRRLESLAQEMEELQKKLDAEPADSPAAAERREELQRLSKRLREESEALKQLSQQLLPYKLDEELTKQLEGLGKQLAELAQQAEGSAANSAATNKQLSEQLQALRNQLKQGRDGLQQEAQAPIALLKAILPLKQDEARFMRLYQRQVDLAGRLASLKGRDGEDDPALKSRMRELEDEQRELRQELAALAQAITEHTLQLPEDSRLDKLRSTAEKFAEALRSCGASEAMSEAESGLAEFSGTRGHAGAQRAADLLAALLSQCQGMGGECKNCLPSFKPGGGNGLGQTLDQLLSEMGFGNGSGGDGGMGWGAGNGFSSRPGSQQNVGLYGGNPLADAAGFREGSSTDAQGTVGVTGAGGPGGERGSGYAARRTGTPAAGGDVVVPLRYRQQVGRYLERLSDELGDE